jgi:hypothetical protein
VATRHLRSFLTVATALVSVTCIGTAAGARRPPPVPVTLIAPAADVVIVQNDPALQTICSGINPAYGNGFRITFDWTDYEPVSKVKTYTVELHHGATIFSTSLDTTGAESTYDYIACGNFVTDSNLTGWYWQVIVNGKGPAVQDPEQRPFSFAPCRLADGSACNAPPQ